MFPFFFCSISVANFKAETKIIFLFIKKLYLCAINITLNAMAEKTRYSDDELEEFRQIILAKLDKAKKDYEILKSSIITKRVMIQWIPPHIQSTGRRSNNPVKRRGRKTGSAAAEIYSASAGRSCKNRKQNLWYLRETGKLISKERLRQCRMQHCVSMQK